MQALYEELLHIIHTPSKDGKTVGVMVSDAGLQSTSVLEYTCPSVQFGLTHRVVLHAKLAFPRPIARYDPLYH